LQKVEKCLIAVEPLLSPEESAPSAALTAARRIESLVFYSLLVVIALAAIPYGTTEPWWKAVFQCAVFLLAALAIIAHWLAGGPAGSAKVAHPQREPIRSLCWPLIALVVFALIQSVAWSSVTIAGTNVPQALSADPLQTRLFVVQLSALVLVAWVLVRCTSNARRVRLLIDLIVALGVVSAVFGLWRQATQHQAGFVLPYLRPGFGYAQFINANHFAYLMEMALGLSLGVVIGRGVAGRRFVIYLIAALPMWVALVLCGSRGGLLSILCQVVFLASWFVSGRQKLNPKKNGRSLVMKVVLVAMLLIGAISTVVFVGGDPLSSRLDTISIELDRKTADTFTLRSNIWRATWHLIKDHPLAGTGFGAFRVAITKYHQASGVMTPQEAHNEYLELPASGGLIGLAIGVWCCAAFVRLTRRALATTDRRQKAVVAGALAAILSVAVHSLVDFGLHVTVNSLVFTVLLVLLNASAGIRGGEKASEAATW
jgi:O-antigen ligase